MKLQFIKYTCAISLALTASQAYSSSAYNYGVQIANKTNNTFYVEWYEDNLCKSATGPDTLKPNNTTTPFTPSSIDNVYGIVSANETDLNCGFISDLPSSVLIANVGGGHMDIMQEGDFDVSDEKITTGLIPDPIYQFNINGYNGPAPVPAKITTVDFKWDGIESNNVQKLSSTVDLLTSMLSKRYPNYELIDSKITKYSVGTYDIDIKYHDMSKD